MPGRVGEKKRAFRSLPLPPGDGEGFAAAKEAALLQWGAGLPPSIGQLGEKLLHQTVKRYLEPDWQKHELRVGRYVADVLTGGRVYEVQTGSCRSFSKKLTSLLADYPVTLCIPLAREKQVVWVDPHTGEAEPPHRSPKPGAFLDSCYELYWLRALLPHPGLTVRLLLIDLEEYRLRDGWGRDGKRGSNRIDRLPLGLAGERELAVGADYLTLLPPDLPNPFTVAELQKAARLSDQGARRVLAVLQAVGAVAQLGKRGRAFLYQRR